ncbi:sensor histidine kinase [Phytohabitans suffuscus]|uniref:histidine kinase n=1 Tax=Phytohabitans suffuscus TaxID=624315 RepID=A0A6F8YQ31_9ACTN|nr:sensor histidine kinase [Phytohabitans suffuscus]BCB88184.1 two-component sensor histidine kinase [Phytohabitans suffuscus]
MNRKRGLRGPFARWPRASDATLAAVLFLATTLVTDGPADTIVTRPITGVPIPVLAVFAVAAAGMYRRRDKPIRALGVAVAGWALMLPTREYDVGLITLFAVYSAGRYSASGRKGQIGLAAAMAVLVAEALVRWTPLDETVAGVVVMFVVWYTGRRLRLREERAAERRERQAAEARRIVAEERTHIARELHDVVAHQVSLMTVQAGAAQAVAATDPESARQAMAAVEQAGRQALDELRHLLGVLRPETRRDGLGPQPGLADLPRLVGQFAAAGVDVRVSDGLRAALPTRIQLSAYRIIQEALTNVLKHGGPGTGAEVHLREDGTDIVIEIIDHAQPVAPSPQAAGHGIIGMRERATLLGGTLETGPRPEGGFRVSARLPVAGESA